MTTSGLIKVVVAAITREAQDINSYELRPLDGCELPAFSAGAHVEIHLPNGNERSYSLSNSQSETNRYVITVANDPNSRGGSRYLHEEVGLGDMLSISTPRNNFALNEGATHSLFIAGGIGITPLWCMVQRLQALGRSWKLIYCARTPAQTAFMDALNGLDEPAKKGVRFNFDGEPGGRMLDIAAAVTEAPPGAHIYCCGPLPMLTSFEQATASRPPELVHVEYFAPKRAPDLSGQFTVVLQRSGRELAIAEGKTILDTILEAGLDVPYSCMEGTCGECETRVISGIPVHRDSCLTKADQAANTKIMICCSGSKSERLVLDL